MERRTSNSSILWLGHTVSGGKKLMERREEEVAPADLFSWLNAMPLYPKVYWRSSQSKHAYACIGSLEQRSSDSRVFHWQSFCAKDAPEWREYLPGRTLLPRFELIQREQKTFFAANDANEFSFHLPRRQTPIPNARATVNKRLELPNQVAWIQGIQSILREIQQGRIQKIVAARRVVLECHRPIPALSIVKALSQDPERTVFLIQPSPQTAFLGASPEWLYRRDASLIHCDALAATRSILQAKELFESEKDLREFRIVKERLLEQLTPFCSLLPSASIDCIKYTANLAHLYSELQGHLNDSVTDSDLLQALHPTAAIAGFPKQEALEYLFRKEPFARGLYASPLGWKSPKRAEYTIGIRSCLLSGSTAYLYAGAGIVDGSDPLSEWEETEQKLQSWKTIFEE